MSLSTRNYGFVFFAFKLIKLPCFNLTGCHFVRLFHVTWLDITCTHDDGEGFDTRLKSYKLLDFILVLCVSVDNSILLNSVDMSCVSICIKC